MVPRWTHDGWFGRRWLAQWRLAKNTGRASAGCSLPLRPQYYLHLLPPLNCPTDDEQFKEEKAVIIKEISLLQPPPPGPAA